MGELGIAPWYGGIRHHGPPTCHTALPGAVVDFLMKHGAALDAADEQGNFLFHLLVLHDLPDMYDYAGACAYSVGRRLRCSGLGMVFLECW